MTVRSTSEQPWCQWETYIASNSPTLRWFSCVETKGADLTFFANTITANLPTTGQGHSNNSASSSSTSSTSAQNGAENDSALSTGAIIGIAVGGGIALVGGLAILAFCCLKRRKSHSQKPQELPPNPILPQMSQPHPMELDSHAYTRSELNSTTAYSPRSQPSTPFTPADRYATSVEDIDMWRRGMTTTPSDGQSKEAYYARTQPPRELHEGRREE